MKVRYLLVLFGYSSLLLTPTACSSAPQNEQTRMEQAELNVLAVNASQYGMKYPETFVLMQNRMGIRIEYNLDRANLQLWISPQAGKSIDYRDRNWSNRDDHTNIFDRILLPDLRLNDFVKCDYDPFHSVLHFKNQKLHLASVYDRPVVLIWCEKDCVVDFKSFKSDKRTHKEDKVLVIEHNDRGRDFEFAAVIGPGEGYFQHQPTLDDGRSIYARAHIKGGQLLAITGELREENPSRATRDIADRKIDQLLAENEAKTSRDLDHGRFLLRDRPEMQKLLEKNRRIALSMQDFKGFMRSTNQYIYYLLWFRDGGMNVSHIGYTGWVQPLRDHVPFALLNPNTSTAEPKGRFFGQLISGPITKWQEDGLFYVVWPAFTYWTQTGDDRYCKGKYLSVMEEALDWLERYCFDEKKGLFGRYYYCETPLTNSTGDGWDMAIGRPVDKFETRYNEMTIVRAYDIYINALNYSTYIMLSAMENGPKAEVYLQKAKRLEEGIRRFFDYGGELPSAGYLLTPDGKLITAEPYGLNKDDYRWALSLAPFHPNLPLKYRSARDKLRHDMTSWPKGTFLCSYNAVLTAMDTEIHDEDAVMEALDYLVPQSVRPGKYLPMPYTIPEIIDIEDGDPFHDVRPLVFSIAPWLSAVTNLGLRRLPFGIALRATKYLDTLKNYEYRDSLIDIRYEGEGAISEILVNGRALQFTYQIPESLLEQVDTQILVKMAPDTAKDNLLVSSTVRLDSVSKSGEKVRFDIEAYGKNVLVFRNLKKNLSLHDSSDRLLEVDSQQMGKLSFVEFDGRGKFHLILK